MLRKRVRYVLSHLNGRIDAPGQGGGAPRPRSPRARRSSISSPTSSISTSTRGTAPGQDDVRVNAARQLLLLKLASESRRLPLGPPGAAHPACKLSRFRHRPGQYDGPRARMNLTPSGQRLDPSSDPRSRGQGPFMRMLRLLVSPVWPSSLAVFAVPGRADDLRPSIAGGQEAAGRGRPPGRQGRSRPRPSSATSAPSRSSCPGSARSRSSTRSSAT